METIFDGEHVRVKVARRSSHVVCVSFSDHFQPEGEFRAGFGEPALEEGGVTSIYVLSRFNHWWQTPEMVAALAGVKGAIAGYGPRSVVTYGASMGGYGAIYFASELGADRAIAFSPQTDIWDNPLETRWRKEAAAWPKLLHPVSEVLTSSCEYILVYDPLETLDAMQVGMLTGAKHLHLRHCGHRSVPLLHEIGYLKGVLLSALDGVSSERINAAMLNTLRAKRRQSSTYLSHFLTRLVRKNRLLFVGRILDQMKSRNYLAAEEIHSRDFIAFARVASKMEALWLLEVLIARAGGSSMKEPMRTAFIATFKQHGLTREAELITG